MIPVEFAEGLGAGLVVAGVLYLALWYWTRRARNASVVPGASATAPDASAEDPPRVESPPSIPALSLPSPPERTNGALPSEFAATQGLSSSASPADRGLPTRSTRPTGPTDRIRLSQRIVLHVYAQGDLPPGAVAPPGFCQAGIGEALGISQAGLAAVLRRLEAAGIFTTERGHVRGHDRRLKIYRLSARGLAIAKELRARNGRPVRRR